MHVGERDEALEGAVARVDCLDRQPERLGLLAEGRAVGVGLRREVHQHPALVVADRQALLVDPESAAPALQRRAARTGPQPTETVAERPVSGALVDGAGGAAVVGGGRRRGGSCGHDHRCREARWPSVVSSSREVSLRDGGAPMTPHLGRLCPERQIGLEMPVQAGRMIQRRSSSAHPAVFRAFATSTHQASVRLAEVGVLRLAWSTTSQVSQVWPNSPACRTRWLPSGQPADLGRGRLPVRRAGDRCGSPRSPRPSAITVRAKAGVDRPREHPGAGRGARRRRSTSSRSRAPRPCPTPGHRPASSPFPYDASESGLAAEGVRRPPRRGPARRTRSGAPPSSTVFEARDRRGRRRSGAAFSSSRAAPVTQRRATRQCRPRHGPAIGRRADGFAACAPP